MSDKKEQLQAALACNRDVPKGPPTAKMDCPDVVNISVFFDGRGNHKDERDKKWSNVARLWLAAFQHKSKTNYPIYISGIGTPYNGEAADWLDQVQASEVVAQAAHAPVPDAIKIIPRNEAARACA